MSAMKAVDPDFSLFTPELDLEIWKITKAVCRNWRDTFSRCLSVQLHSAALPNKMHRNSIKQLHKIKSLVFSTLAQGFLEAILSSFSVGVTSRAKARRSHGKAWTRGNQSLQCCLSIHSRTAALPNPWTGLGQVGTVGYPALRAAHQYSHLCRSLNFSRSV